LQTVLKPYSVDVPASTLSSLCESIPVLLEYERLYEASIALRQTLSLIRTRMDAIRVADSFRAASGSALGNQEFAQHAVHAAYRAGMVARCQEICELHPNQFPAIEAWLQAQLGDWQGAFKEIQRIQHNPTTNPSDLEIIKRLYPRALYNTRQHWKQAFRETSQALTGRQRGLCLLEYGATLTNNGEQANARTVYSEAFGYLEHDDFFAALLQYNIGMACLHQSELTAAEHAFLRAMRHARKPQGNAYLSGAWYGLGAVRRARQEYPRALDAFQMALVKAATREDRLYATRGLGYTLRLLNRLDEAMVAFAEARSNISPHDLITPHGLYADIAAARMQNNDEKGALEALELTLEHHEEDKQRANIVKAEDQRRQGNQKAALELLNHISTNRLWYAEEAMSFPELFAMHGVVVIKHPMTIRVNTDGPVQVWINQHKVAIKPTSSAMSLLVFLCLENGSTSIERVLEAMTFKTDLQAKKKKTLYATVEDLRNQLGWKQAIQIHANTLSLDPDPLVQWDTLETPPPTRTETFCEGLYDPWIINWRDEHLSKTHSNFIL
jgi:tetratricopeptide (TPR) repeat protein